MKISANVLVENEENFLWFAVTSVIAYVDEVLIYNAGSVDYTRRVISELVTKFPDKIIVKHLPKLTKEEYPAVRQEMLEKSSGDWIFILDGDEVWWESSIAELTKQIHDNGNSLDSIVSYFTNCIGDLFHFQDEKKQNYIIDGKKGALTIRAFSKHLPGLHVDREYGREGFFSEQTLIQDLSSERRMHLVNTAFLHMTHLSRSDVGSKKMKSEVGHAFPLDYYYPEALFKERPSFVSYPFYVRGKGYLLKSAVRKAAKSIYSVVR